MTAPGGRLHPPARQLVPRRFIGRVLVVTFRTGLDLSPWIPEQFERTDPHLAHLKVYEMKTRFSGEDADPLVDSQYQEAILGVDAAVPGSVARQYNLLNLHSRPWAVGRGNPMGHRLRHVSIESTWTFPHGPDHDGDPGWRAFDVDAHRLTSPVLRFRGELGEPTPRTPEMAYNGFVSLTDDDRPYEDSLADLDLGRVTYGGGALTFFASPDDLEVDRVLLGSLGEVDVLGCSLRDIAWTRSFPR